MTHRDAERLCSEGGEYREAATPRSATPRSGAPRPETAGEPAEPAHGVPDDVIQQIFGPGTGPHYDRIIEVTLHGMDRAWKQALLESVPSARRALDLACGTGQVIAMLKDRFPGCEVVAVDMNEEYLDVARQRIAKRGDEGVTFVHSRAEDATYEGTFDLVISAYLPKYADLPHLVPRLVRHLEPGGLFVMQDFTWPSDRFVAEFLEQRFEELVEWAERELPAAVGMFEVLPGVVKESEWVEELCGLLEEEGMEGVEVEFLDLEQAAIVQARKPLGPSSSPDPGSATTT